MPSLHAFDPVGSWLRRALFGVGPVVLIAGASYAPLQAQVSGRADTLVLTIDSAHALALHANPDLLTARSDIGVARGEVRQAGLIAFNPGVEVLGSGASGSPAELSLSEEIEVAGQRGVRRRVARAGLSRAEHSASDVARLTLADVDREFYRVVTTDRRALLAGEVLALNERLEQVAARQLAAGEISKLDYNLAIVELGRSRAGAMAARREQRSSRIELRRLLGLPAATPIMAAFDSTLHRHVVIDSAETRVQVDLSEFGEAGDTGVAGLVARALAARPDLAEREAAIVQAEAQVTLAQREALPNLVARLLSEQRADGRGRSLHPGIGLSVPLFNRNQGEVEARRAAARSRALGRTAVAARVRAEVESAFGAYQAAAGEVEVLERTVLGPARENRRLLEIAYREGKVGLPVLLLIRNQVIDAEQDYWTAWFAERVAAAELRAAIGLVNPSTAGEAP